MLSKVAKRTCADTSNAAPGSRRSARARRRANISGISIAHAGRSLASDRRWPRGIDFIARVARDLHARVGDIAKRAVGEARARRIAAEASQASAVGGRERYRLQPQRIRVRHGNAAVL